MIAAQGHTPSSAELPRKKSRNYLDSHKNIEKKRRDRINTCLNQLKGLVPDCRQYVSLQPPGSLLHSDLSLSLLRATRNWIKPKYWR